MPGDGQGTGAGRQLLAEQLYEGAQPEAFGLDRVDAVRLERHRGDRSYAGRQHLVSEGGEQLGQHAALLGAGEEGHGGRRAGERHGVQATRDGGVQQPVHGSEVLGGSHR